MIKEDTLSSYRVIDANLNRLKEGIRVVEDIFRYIFNDSEIGYKLKEIRHLSKVDNYNQIIKTRDSINDCLKPSTKSEFKRESIEQIVIANFKRAQESARVLEEIYKMIEPNEAEKFKTIRYKIYNLEKETLLKLEKLNIKEA